MLTKFIGIKACVFDAYGTLLDVHSAVERHRARLGNKADPVSGMWRTKQLQYMWLRTIIDRYVDFWRLTVDGLDFALDAHGVDDAALRDDLLDAYLRLDCYPEVPGVLSTLKNAGLRTAILSSASPMMLEAAVESAGIGDVLDAVISVRHPPSRASDRTVSKACRPGRNRGRRSSSTRRRGKAQASCRCRRARASARARPRPNAAIPVGCHLQSDRIVDQGR